MTPRDAYLATLDRVCLTIHARDFSDLRSCLECLRADETPLMFPDLVAPSVNRLRGTFNDLHNDIMHGGRMNMAELIAAFEQVPFHDSPLPLMSGSALLTLVAATIATTFDWSVGGAGRVPPATLLQCETYLQTHESSVTVPDAYYHTARGILSYVRHDQDSAFASFARADAYFDEHPALSPRDHLMWVYRGICNALSESAITSFLTVPSAASSPTDYILAASQEEFVSFCAADIVYFRKFAASLAASFFRANAAGALHIHVMLEQPADVREVFAFRASLAPDERRRLGVSWSPRHDPAAPNAFGADLDPADFNSSLLTMVRYFLCEWVVSAYRRPTFIHDIDIVFVAGWSRVLAWSAAADITVAHHEAGGYASCMPWFDRMAGTLLINHNPVGQFYARCLSRVGRLHFASIRHLRYNIDQNVISSLTRYFIRHVPEFRAQGYNLHCDAVWVDHRNVPPALAA